METNWNVIETENFVRSCERINIPQNVVDSLRMWATSIRRQITPRNSRPFISPNNVFEIWIAGIGNPDANKGKSGGYRFVYYVLISERKIFIDMIEERKNLKFKRSSGKKQKHWDNHLIELKKELMRKYEC